MKIQYDFFKIFERLGHMHENKIFFYFFFASMKTKYFNTGFVYLQYKNTNQYQSKCSKKIYEKITNFFEIIYEKILFYFYFL